MDNFTHDRCDLFCRREWLVKTDNKTSTPFLFKFDAPRDGTAKCAVIVTDTKFVYGEVLNTQQAITRWRTCNPDAQPDNFQENEAWLSAIDALLSDAHTLGAFKEASIEVSTETPYADLAFTLTYDAFTWRWETSFLGAKLSSDILSKQLVIPLISFNHLAFTSATLPSQLSEDSLQSSIDKTGRTARRAIDTHVKNALSKPSVATGLSRLTCLIHSYPSPPDIRTTLDISPHLKVPEARDVVVGLKPSSPATNPTTSSAINHELAPQKFLSSSSPVADTLTRRETPIVKLYSTETSRPPLPPTPDENGNGKVDIDSDATQSSSDEEMPSFNLPENSKSAGLARLKAASQTSSQMKGNTTGGGRYDKMDILIGVGGLRDENSNGSASPPPPETTKKKRLVKRTHSKFAASSSDLEAEVIEEQIKKKKNRSASPSGVEVGPTAVVEKAQRTVSVASGSGPKRGGGTRQPAKRGRKRF